MSICFKKPACASNVKAFKNTTDLTFAIKKQHTYRFYHRHKLGKGIDQFLTLITSLKFFLDPFFLVFELKKN